MTIVRARLTSLAAALVVGVLVVGCGTVERAGGTTRDRDSSEEPSPSTHSPSARESSDLGPGAGRPTLLADDKAPVAEDLGRLAESFVSYALGDSDSFPHGESVSMSLGGEQAASIDDVATALTERGIWKVCPAGWETYSAASCPVDLLGPIISARVNDASLVYSGEYRDVVCAPTRTGPIPPGRLVVLTPAQARRTCASDFALVLSADQRGRLRHIDLTLSEP